MIEQILINFFKFRNYFVKLLLEIYINYFKDLHNDFKKALNFKKKYNKSKRKCQKYKLKIKKLKLLLKQKDESAHIFDMLKKTNNILEQKILTFEKKIIMAETLNKQIKKLKCENNSLKQNNKIIDSELRFIQQSNENNFLRRQDIWYYTKEHKLEFKQYELFAKLSKNFGNPVKYNNNLGWYGLELYIQ